ncbi:hypothetical protein [Streptomyces sp. NPDC057403]|uniref:hypothetical protein n=1 Tax=Streptomyces sp. NPDC057403 TaxID=3346119 RepID=UPI003696F111
MDWGDVPAWIACGVAFAAAVFSGVALKHSRESAQAAKRSAESADRSASAAERSAAADEAALAETRREAEERRAAEAEAARPKPQLRVDHVGGVRYILRNVGSGPAVNVNTVRAGQPDQCRNLPNGETIEAGDGHEFVAVTAMGMPLPTAIYVTWDGQATPKALPVPQ